MDRVWGSSEASSDGSGVEAVEDEFLIVGELGTEVVINGWVVVGVRTVGLVVVAVVVVINGSGVEALAVGGLVDESGVEALVVDGLVDKSGVEALLVVSSSALVFEVSGTAVTTVSEEAVEI